MHRFLVVQLVEGTPVEENGRILSPDNVKQAYGICRPTILNSPMTTRYTMYVSSDVPSKLEHFLLSPKLFLDDFW